jgi:hypothetical protein
MASERPHQMKTRGSSQSPVATDDDMSATAIGEVKSGSGKTHEAKWDQTSKDVYVSWAG